MLSIPNISSSSLPISIFLAQCSCYAFTTFFHVSPPPPCCAMSGGTDPECWRRRGRTEHGDKKSCRRRRCAASRLSIKCREILQKAYVKLRDFSSCSCLAALPCLAPAKQAFLFTSVLKGERELVWVGGESEGGGR